jgi:hypothetical protein
MAAATLTQTRIKVDRLKLIEALESARKRDDGDRAKAQERYDAAVTKARDELAAVLAKASADNAKPSKYGGYPLALELKSRTMIPPKPESKAKHDCDLKNMVAVLKLSTEPTVSLSAEQYARYFPCEA